MEPLRLAREFVEVGDYVYVNNYVCDRVVDVRHDHIVCADSGRHDSEFFDVAFLSLPRTKTPVGDNYCVSSQLDDSFALASGEHVLCRGGGVWFPTKIFKPFTVTEDSCLMKSF
ncbi:hypothetical protein [Actinomyces vulturis]|uniref:hypothetical protein n=1 Tax=Actinomyces vulturis TaxID=1857645 RepID=UPI001147568F|nr:hypothetical protein [Actinomyces vulturis]